MHIRTCFHQEGGKMLVGHIIQHVPSLHVRLIDFSTMIEQKLASLQTIKLAIGHYIHQSGLSQRPGCIYLCTQGDKLQCQLCRNPVHQGRTESDVARNLLFTKEIIGTRNRHLLHSNSRSTCIEQFLDQIIGPPPLTSFVSRKHRMQSRIAIAINILQAGMLRQSLPDTPTVPQENTHLHTP